MKENYATRCVATGVSIVVLLAVVLVGYFTNPKTATVIFFALGPVAVVWGSFPHGIHPGPKWHRHYAWLMLCGAFSLAAVAAVKATRRWNL